MKKKEEIKKYYKSTLDNIWERAFISKDRFQLRRWEVILNLSQELSSKKVLELGCADGVLSILAAKRGAEVTGIDISPLNIEAARHHAKEAGVSKHVRFLEGNIEDTENLIIEENYYDVVLASEILEHLFSPKLALRLAYKCLKDGKILILSVPNLYFKIPRKFLSFFKNPFSLSKIRNFLTILNSQKIKEEYGRAPHYLFSPKYLTELIEKEGFKIEYVQAIGWTYEAYTGKGKICDLARRVDRSLSGVLPFNRLGHCTALKSRKIR